MKVPLIPNHDEAVRDFAVIQDVLSRSLVSLGFEVLDEANKVRSLENGRLAVSFEFVVKRWR